MYFMVHLKQASKGHGEQREQSRVDFEMLFSNTEYLKREIATTIECRMVRRLHALWLNLCTVLLHLSNVLSMTESPTVEPVDSSILHQLWSEHRPPVFIKLIVQSWLQTTHHWNWKVPSTIFRATLCFLSCVMHTEFHSGLTCCFTHVICKNELTEHKYEKICFDKHTVDLFFFKCVK